MTTEDMINSTEDKEALTRLKMKYRMLMFSLLYTETNSEIETETMEQVDYTLFKIQELSESLNIPYYFE